ncbi:LIM and SH3 domain protein F42H10.3 [Cydia splendana]|uniref:LIM and SH3 domain protein F42H10.3 n=1 Tax=Cydia splendana TaxID=1100963 RepID=UPI00214236F2
MNKTCARCEKTVYPTEELKCLDKAWHKGCFKCQECGMTLNMRTYKGYGKLPYCESHVPKAKHTTMAETPELKRIAENTKLQSNVKYHADFEKSKGKFTQVADDPETLRIKANTKIISNVAYHGDLEKKAQMEKQRQINENGELVDVPSDNYHQQLENYANEMLPVPPPQKQPQVYQPPPAYQNQNQNQSYQNQNQQYQNQSYQTNQSNHQPVYNQNQYRPQPKQYEDYQQKYDDYQNQFAYGQYQQPGANYGVGSQQKIGRIQDYDPLVDGPRAPPNTQRASATLIYNSTSDGKRGSHHHQQQQQQAQSTRQIGRVADLDPLSSERAAYAGPDQNYMQVMSNKHEPDVQKVYIAMYDYEANDSDEVSFREGDLISNVTAIDEGWMTGQVLRTGRTGMLPANYVERAPQGTYKH